MMAERTGPVVGGWFAKYCRRDSAFAFDFGVIVTCAFLRDHATLLS